jgi:hypothetical protein
VNGPIGITKNEPESSAFEIADLGQLLAVSALLLPVFGAIGRYFSLLPHAGIPFQAVFQVSVGELATLGLIGLIGPALFVVTMAALNNTVASAWFPLHVSTAANTQAESILESTQASINAVQSDVDRLAAETSDFVASESPTKAQAKRLLRSSKKVQERIERNRGDLAAANSAVAQARSSLDDAEKALRHPLFRLGAKIGKEPSLRRRVFLVSGVAVVGLLLFGSVALTAFPAGPITLATYGVLEWWILGKAAGDQRISVRKVVLPVLLAGAVAAAGLGLDATPGQQVWVAFTPTSPNPSGWYVQISDAQDTVYLLPCSGIGVIEAPMATISSLRYSANEPHVDSSLLHWLQTGEQLSFGVRAICPASGQPPP